jgi:hypothetical protein
MLSSKALKDLFAEARPIIERQLDDAELIAGLREVVTAQGGDWSSLKALLKAQIQDERDEAGEGKRVRKILDKADYSAAYADLLGLNMNENNNSADEFDIETGEFHTPIPSQDGKTESEGLASAPVTEHEQARVSSHASQADPAKPLPLGSWVGHPFNDTGPHVFSDQEPGQ